MTTAPIHGFTDTWNDAGVTFSAVLVDVTDTASAAGSTLLDLQVGSTSQMSVTKAGEVVCRGLTSSQNVDLQGNRLVMDADNDTYLEAGTDDRLDFVVGGSLVARFDANATDTFQLDGIGFSPTGATVGQALGFPNSASTLEPYTPAGGGDLLAAANETITGDWNFTGVLEWNGEPVLKTLLDTAALTALIEADLSDGELVYVKSYGTATGYGGGYFRWDASSTATADQFLVFAPDASDGTGRWVRTGYAWLSPEMAGALGDSDGTAGSGTDDTAAFRRVGAVLEADATMKLRCEQPGAIYRIYSGVGDTADIWNVTDVNGFQWDMNGCTLYADRDIRSESTTAFPFQFDGGSNVRVWGGKLRTRARTIDQTSDVAGMRWFYFTGTGHTVELDLDASDSVEAVLFQRIYGTDAVTDRWSDLELRITATRCTYGLPLTHSGDNARFYVEADGCFRSFFATGVKNSQGVVVSKNHRGGDLKVKAVHKSGQEDDQVIGGQIYYIVNPADHAETFAPGVNIDIANEGVDGATIDGLRIIAVIDSDSTKFERQALIWNRLDDSSVVDTTATGRGHVARASISVSCRNAISSNIDGRLIELFDPTYNGDWTNETIDLELRDSKIAGLATNDVYLGLNGQENGPRLINVDCNSDLLTSGTHPNPNETLVIAARFANAGGPFQLGTLEQAAGFTALRSAGGAAARVGAASGVPTFVLESNNGGGNFGGQFVFEDSGVNKFAFASVANGQMRVYANGNSSTGVFCANWSAAGHYHPGADGTFDLGITGTRWRNVYADDYEATNGYSVGGNQVVGSRLTSVVKLTDSSGGTADDTVQAVSGSGADSAINNNFADLTDRINKIIDRLGTTAGHGLTSD